MKTQIIKEVKRSYFATGLEKTQQTLVEIERITKQFSIDGPDRVLAALEVRGYDLIEIESQSEKIQTACEKMQREYKRAQVKKEKFLDFATDVNDYYDEYERSLSVFRSHMCALRDVLKRYNNKASINKTQCEKYDITPHSLTTDSILGGGVYQMQIFPIEEQPTEVQFLYDNLVKFFNYLDKGMELCKEMIAEVKQITNNPQLSLGYLRKYRNEYEKRLKNQHMLITRDVIETLKVITPSYQKKKYYASEADYASGEYHQHNIADMDNYCLIERYELKWENDFTEEELDNWHEKEEIAKIRLVTANFDLLLPEDFDPKKMMGQYMYFFCRWAMPNNIKAAHSYFIHTYAGDYTPVEYNSVSHHSKKFDEKDPRQVSFLRKITKLTTDDCTSEPIAINNKKIAN